MMDPNIFGSTIVILKTTQSSMMIEPTRLGCGPYNTKCNWRRKSVPHCCTRFLQLPAIMILLLLLLLPSSSMSFIPVSSSFMSQPKYYQQQQPSLINIAKPARQTRSTTPKHFENLIIQSNLFKNQRNNKCRRNALPDSNNNDLGSGSGSSNMASSFLTALCVIPPVEAWDRLQRARHHAQDPMYHEWPPAIRLLHPFVLSSFPSASSSTSASSLSSFGGAVGSKSFSAALEVAHVIEELDIEPFSITLNEWTILPHMEIIQMEWEKRSALPHLESIPEPINTEDDEVQALIAREEKIGREKLIARTKVLNAKKKKQEEEQQLLKKQQKQEEDGGGENFTSNNDSDNDNKYDDPYSGQQKKRNSKKSRPLTSPSSSYYDRTTTTSQSTPKQVFEAQQRQRRREEEFEEFDGPCILCLEPDIESRRKLCELHDALQELLPLKSRYTSPSSLYSWNITGTNGDEDDMSDDFSLSKGYRPIIPISAFPSVSTALPVARQLKGLWDPLTFDVTELHVVSCLEDEDAMGWMEPPSSSSSNVMLSSASSSAASSLTASASTMIQSSKDKSPWGCNAKIMLLGHEVEQDEDENQRMIQTLLEEGEPGGLDISMDYTVLDDEEDDDIGGDGSTEALRRWLNEEEDDFDEGSVVIIGRTHFFTGEKRTYLGMPATSSVDAKDRLLGGTVQGGLVSGAARRRRTTHRGGSGWEDGEFGYRQSDYRPWSKREVSQRRQYDKQRQKEEEEQQQTDGDLRWIVNKNNEDDDT